MLKMTHKLPCVGDSIADATLGEKAFDDHQLQCVCEAAQALHPHVCKCLQLEIGREDDGEREIDERISFKLDINVQF